MSAPLIRYAYEMSTEPDSDSALVARAVLRLGRRLRAERPDPSVTLAALGLLSTLHRLGPMTAARLAEAERLQPQSLSRLLPRLEKAGLIVRDPGPLDRRTLVLSITPEGRKALSGDIRARRAWLEQAMRDTLSPEERGQLLAAAELMLRLADEGLESEAAQSPAD